MQLGKEINLLEINERENIERKSTQNKRMKTSILFLGIFGAIFAGVFFYHAYVQNTFSDISSKAAGKEREVESFKAVEEKYMVKKDKLKAISGIVLKRPDLVPLLDLLQNATPEGISYETIGIPSSDKITLAGEAKDSNILTKYFYTLSDDINFTKYLKDVTMNSLNLDKAGVYNFDLTLTLTVKKI